MMQSLFNQELKQIKVDNWGSFFLQRLLKFYFNEEFFDLAIKFHESNNVLKVHKLVISTCTNYFSELEQEQLKNDYPKQEKVILVPPSMSYECVKSIVSFIYTGELSYWTSEQSSLYYAAKKMDIPILIKLLEAQTNSSERNTLSSLPSEQPENKDLLKSCIPFQSLSEKRCIKRKTGGSSITSDFDSELHNTIIKQNYSDFNGPYRFDVAEIEELNLGLFSSFDDITYNTEPIIQANEKKIECDIIDSSVEVNSNIILKISKNSELIEKNYVCSDTLISDWEESESSSQCEDILSTDRNKFLKCSNKKVKSRKSKFQCTKLSCQNNVDHNHTKIVKEVLKKYPYLMQQNKNIKLKVLKKESKNAEQVVSGKKKISYIVLKSDSLLNNDLNKFQSLNNESIDQETKNNEFGPWICLKCNLNDNYSDYHSFRIHMQDVHGEKFDPRICEYCGFKTSKRNTLMYHLYTKHNISPPRSLTFPKCQECSYVALSKSFLNKHQINHKHYSTNLIAENFNNDSISSCEKKSYPVNLKHDQVLQICKDFSNHDSSISKQCKIRLDILNTTANATLDKREKQSYKLTVNDEKLKQLVNLRSFDEIMNKSVDHNKKNENNFDSNVRKLDWYSHNIHSKLKLIPEVQDAITKMDDEGHHHQNQIHNKYLPLANRDNDNTPISAIQTTNYDDTVTKKNFQNIKKIPNFTETFDDLEKMVIDEQHETFDEFGLTTHFENKEKLNHKKKEVRTFEEKQEQINQYVEEETEILEYEMCNYN